MIAIIETPQVVTATFLTALALIESSGDPDAVGDDGNAVGMYQLTKICVRDVNRILGRRLFSYRDRLDAHKSRMMARVYLTYWGSHFRDGGFKVGPGQLCAIHRWGPGWRPWKETALDRNRAKKLRKIMEDITTSTD